MEPPRIQYARTSDGVHIAYWTLGDGPPLVLMTAHGGNIRAEWEIPEFRAAYTTLSKHFAWSARTCATTASPTEAWRISHSKR